MSSKDPKLPLRHILQAIERIEQHVAGMDFAAYRDDPKTSDAVERNLQRISEAAIRLGEQGPASCPEIPWPDVRGIGNWLRHQYGPHRAGNDLEHGEREPAASQGVCREGSATVRA